ncbi:hypothetical protein IQ244_25970 [Nostoc sp. LEGE 06077]|uniref:hypothetical protein n=1 Tax=Nostoc sp. LEGE 06077 TaxID=915325 RepID=UPI001880B762|nr:hypothetical protein [Nostoc sp. LEGE 06077]MBE9209880.1 hypothetical protein [Nostoc sp. LEGE 06077]
MNNYFSPYKPAYTLSERFERFSAIFTATSTVASHLLLQTRTKFAASVEVTDRCNAGCHYCYVYSSEWDQNKRIQGYLQLSSKEHHQREKQVFETLEKLHKQGIVGASTFGRYTSSGRR